MILSIVLHGSNARQQVRITASDCQPMSTFDRRHQSCNRFAMSIFTAMKNFWARCTGNDDDLLLDVSSDLHRVHKRPAFRPAASTPTRSHVEDASLPVTIGSRGRLQVSRSFRKLADAFKEEENDGTDKANLNTNEANKSENIEIVHYRLQRKEVSILCCSPVRQKQSLTPEKQESNSMWHWALSFIGIDSGENGGIYDDGVTGDSGIKIFGVSPNFMVTSYLHWTFRSSFIAVLFSSAVGFFCLTLMFAFLIVLSGSLKPQCIYDSSSAFYSSSFGEKFADAYMLSWTTFATVVRTL